jgi:serine/threonine-protein kinase RIO1
MFQQVLVMSFIGRDGYAAPRLKDATLTHDDAISACRQVATTLSSLVRLLTDIPHPNPPPR